VDFQLPPEQSHFSKNHGVIDGRVLRNQTGDSKRLQALSLQQGASLRQGDGTTENPQDGRGIFVKA